MGHCNVLKWPRRYVCSWDKNTCVYAVMNDHLDVPKWVSMNGIPAQVLYGMATLRQRRRPGQMAVHRMKGNAHRPQGMTNLRSRSGSLRMAVRVMRGSGMMLPWKATLMS